MNLEVKSAWVSALKSGHYSQTTACLKDDAGYCCLGVLCDLHAKTNGQIWEGRFYLGRSGYPPEEVMEWAGLDSEQRFALASLNDNQRKNFSQIAEYIEARL
jgi:hypothetical protein